MSTSYQILPPLTPQEYAALKADIAAHGIKVPIERDDRDALLDGHHRMRALEELRSEGVDVADPPVLFRIGLSEAEKRAHVRSLNLNRRHLSASQRRAVIEEQLKDSPERSDRAIAAELNVSHSTVGMVRRRLGECSTSSGRNVQLRVGRDGRKRRLPAPRTIIASDGAQARRAVAAMAALPPDALPERFITATDASIAARIVRRETAREERMERLRDPGDLSRRGRPQYTIIYADPPWRYVAASDPTRQAERQYPTMSHDELLALPVNDIAAPSAVLFLWATPPKLGEAIELIDAWRFTYKTSAVWDKQALGMGSWYRLSHELLLIATRGDVPPPAPSARPGSVIRSPRLAHSEKPELVRQHIDAMYPGLAKIELFARGAVPTGWSAWGFEAHEAGNPRRQSAS